MAGIEPAGEKIVQRLQEAVSRLHEDIARVELWAGALGCFTRPIPDYDPATSRYALPPQQTGKRGKNGKNNGKNRAHETQNGGSNGRPRS